MGRSVPRLDSGAAAAAKALRLKVSAEVYDLSDLADEVATHVGLVTSF